MGLQLLAPGVAASSYRATPGTYRTVQAVGKSPSGPHDSLVLRCVEQLGAGCYT